MGFLHTKCEWSKNHNDANDDQHDRQHGEVRRIQKIVKVGDVILDISSYSNQTNAGTISYHPVIQGNIRRFWQQGISDFQLPEAELRAIGVTNPAGLNRRMFPMNKRVVYYFTTMRLIGLEVVSCA